MNLALVPLFIVRCLALFIPFAGLVRTKLYAAMKSLAENTENAEVNSLVSALFARNYLSG